MNTTELTSVVRKIIINGTDFLGVLACDQLSKCNVCKYPAMLVVNTHPSNLPGEHWLTIYITKHRQGCFFDSFGNPPDWDKSPAMINNFLVKNCTNIYYSGRQVQNKDATTCGHHCVFFLYHMQKGMSCIRLINMYGSNLVCNDAMVCRFVSKIRSDVCHGWFYMCSVWKTMFILVTSVAYHIWFYMCSVKKYKFLNKRDGEHKSVHLFLIQVYTVTTYKT